MYVCICIYNSLWIYFDQLCQGVLQPGRVCVCMFVCMYVCVCMFLMCMYVCMHACVCSTSFLSSQHPNRHIYIYIYTDTLTHTHTYIYIYMYIYIRFSLAW